jgi:hypothetical protein
MSNAIIRTGRPEWITDDQVDAMAEMVVMAVCEAGYPGIEKHLYEHKHDWYFVGAPRDVIFRAGALVRRHWGMDEPEQSDDSGADQ